MKKGDKVKCVDRLGSEHLTDGKIYEVTAGVGDTDCWGYPIFEGDPQFEIADDEGDIAYCIYPKCAHATWELVE